METLFIIIVIIISIMVLVMVNRGNGASSQTPSIVVVGQIKDSGTGLGKAINDVIDYSQSTLGKDRVETIDITNNLTILSTLWHLWLSNSSVMYFTPAGSKFGNLRDALILYVAHHSNKKIVLHFHNSNFGRVIKSSNLLLKMNHYLYRYVDKIILLGQAQQEMFRGLELADDIFEIIPNAVNGELFIDVSGFGNKTGNKVIYFSNMIEEKGYDKVLEIAKAMSETDFSFTFSGKFYDEVKRQKFEAEIKDLSNVTYIPGVYGEEKVSLLKEQDYFILPSQYKDETLPISMLEAMANGLFILVTPVGVIPEYVNSKTTYLIETDDVDIWADVIKSNYQKHRFEDFNIDNLQKRHDYSNINQAILRVIQGVI